MPTVPDTLQPDGDLLNGWKEIAASLGKGVRTVQRWEQDYGLPVRRLGRDGGEIVIASRTELTSWLNANARLLGPRRAEAPTAVPELSELPSAEPLARVQPSPAAETRRNSRMRWALAAALLVLAAGAWTLRAAMGQRASDDIGNWSVELGSLHLTDSIGRAIGDVKLPVDLSEALNGIDRNRPESGRSRRIDVDNDGASELLFMVDSFSPSPEIGFYLVDGRRRVRWSVCPPDRVVFDGITYGPPWRPHAAALLRDKDGSMLLILGFVHADKSPSLVITVDAAGQERARYYQNGNVEHIVVTEWDHRPTVLLAGTNDESQGASVAIFEGSLPNGHAPFRDRDKDCAGCPEGSPTTFVVFPYSCIALKSHGGGTSSHGSATIDKIWIEGGQTMVAYVGEGVRDVEGQFTATRIYRLGRNLDVQGADPSSGYRLIHNELWPNHDLNVEQPQWWQIGVWDSATHAWRKSRITAMRSDR